MSERQRQQLLGACLSVTVLVVDQLPLLIVVAVQPELADRHLRPCSHDVVLQSHLHNKVRPPMHICAYATAT